MLHDYLIPQCYYPRNTEVISVQLHEICDASESVYAAAMYLRVVDEKDSVIISLVICKTKVAQIKRLMIPRLELCGTVLLARLLSHVGHVLDR